MPSPNELFAIDGLQTNDEVNFALEGLKFIPGKKQPQWVDNPDADGAALAYEPHYSNGEFELQIRIVPQATMDTALAKWGELNAKLQKASLMRDQGGLSIVWTPAGSNRSYTAFALLGEISELPITPTGDLAGWFVNAPVVTVKLVCRPFLYKEKRTLLAGTAAEVPLQTVELTGVGGDVPAEAEMIVIEKSAVDRRHLEWGLDQSSGPLLLTAANLTVAGFTGAVTTRAGAYSAEKVVRGSVVSSWTTLCSTGNLTNIGSYRIKLRVYVTNVFARFRISYRVGDGTFKTLSAVAPPMLEQWVEIDMGEVTFEEVAKGTQRAEIRVQASSPTTTTAVDVNYLMEVPTTSGWGKARGLQTNDAGQLLAYDDFNQSAGNLDAPKALPFGGNWSEAVKTGASGFVINESTHAAQRTALSDSGLNAGCYAIAGTNNYTSCQVSASVSAGTLEFEQTRIGVIARYSSTEKWLMAVLMNKEDEIKKENGTYLVVLKRTGAAAGTELGRVLAPKAYTPDSLVTLTALADGTWSATVDLGLGGPLTVSGQDADLATGGTLASGKPGFYDVRLSSIAVTRKVDNFNVVAVAEAGRVCFASKRAEVRWDETERQDATGSYYGEPSSYRGGRFFVPVGNSRLALKMRRNDVDLEPDANVTDKHEVEVKITERVLAPQ
jgi:hypothetical protein